MAVNVVLKSVWDDKGIKDAQKSIQAVNDKFDRAFKAVGVAAAAAAAAVVVFAKDSIAAASDLTESTNAVNVAFGDAADAILKIGETSAKAMGVSRSEFNQAAVRFSAFAERVVGQGGDVAGFIETISIRASDFASVFNIDVAEALRVFQSGLSGEAEPLKRFGINLLDSEVKAYALRTGLIRVGETMTEQQKVQARYGLLLESTNKTAGDFANTSDSLANQQRILSATFTDLQAQIGTALLPVLGQLISQVADFLLPKLEQFGRWINSPQGKKAVEDLGNAISDVLKNAFDFANWFIRNFDTIKDFFIAIGIGAVAFRTLTGAVQIATTAMALFGTVSATAGFFAIATALAAIAAGMYLVYQNTKKTTEAVEAQRIEILKNEDAWVTATTNGASAYKGLLPRIQYNTGATKGLTLQTASANAHFQELNRLKLDNLRAEVNKSSGELNRFRNIAQSITKAEDPGSVITLPEIKGESAFDQVQKFIKTAQKSLAKAQESFNNTITKAREKYAADQIKIEKDFAKRLADIVDTSQARLRDVFRNSARMSVSDFFTAFNNAEAKRQEAFKQAEEEAKKSNKQFTDVFVGTDPITAYIDSLKNKIAANRRVLDISAKLFEAGFSQVFIEEIIASGDQGGIALAEALLKRTPETIREVQTLFAEVGNQAEDGMRGLAKQIYDEAGFATAELTKLYKTTQIEQQEALKELKLAFDNEILDANLTLIDAVKDIRATFKENIDGMKGDLGGLKKVVDDFYAKLGKVEAEAAKAITPTPGATTPGAAGGIGGLTGVNVSARSVADATGILIDSIEDLEKVRRYFEERIVAASEFAAESITRGNLAAAASAQATRDEMFNQLRAFRAQGTAAVGTIININVKTSSEQSVAMVGKTLGNTITKYVTAGGQVVVSPTN